MKTFLVIILCFISNVCFAQIVERFNDGQFSSEPPWSGSSSHFVVNTSQQLQLNNTVAGASYLSTPFTATSLAGFEWEVYVKQTFSSSGSNYGRVYLASDQALLSGAVNGYYLQLGEAGSNDAVELFRQSGSVHTSVCRAANTMIAASFSIRIRVTRSETGHWTLSIDYSGGTSFVQEAQGTDTTFGSANYFGVYCVYTAGNANKFFFDDLIAGPPLGDITAPVLNSVSVISPTELQLVFSENMSATSFSISNFEATQGLQTLTAELLPDQKTANLTFGQPFVNGQLYELSVRGVTDLAQNEIPLSVLSFRHFVPTPAEDGDLVFNELFTDPSPSVGLPLYEFVELYNNSQKAFDLAGWRLSDLTSSTTLPSKFILPGEYVIITVSAALQNYLAYGPTLALAEMPTLNNTSDTFVLKTPSGITIDSVRYALSWIDDEDKQLGGYTLERLSPSLAPNQALHWAASMDTSGGTPGKPNSVLGRNPDSIPPSIDSVIVVDQNKLRLVFSEQMDLTSLMLVQSYNYDDGVTPKNVTVVSERSALISFEQDFMNGIEKTLVVHTVSDTAGNEIDSTSVLFRYFVPGTEFPGAVVINEIMADPSPTVYLPEVEYVEIVNTSAAPISLDGWTLADATALAHLPAVIILPNEHLTLTSTSNAMKFASVGRTVGVPGFPSLANAGEALTLRNSSGMKMDSVFFQHAWIANAEKADGGWSLERLSYQISSTEPTNWRASIDSLGGTPGYVNSVAGMNPDTVPPKLDSLIVRGELQIELVFSEGIVNNAIDTVHNYSWNDLLPSNVSIYDDGRRVLIQFPEPFPNGLEQRLLVSGISDIAGNVMDEEAIPFMYFASRPVTPGAIVINEIMSDPAPTVQLPEAEFIEIANTTSVPYNLEGWTLTDGTSTCRLPAAIIRSGEIIILTSTSNVAKFSDFGKVVGVTGFPSLNNAGEPIVIGAPDGQHVDSVNYDARWISDLGKRDGGWTLERLRYNFSSLDPINWRVSIDERGGTPGIINSQFGKNPDGHAPRVVSAVAPTSRQVVLTFDEPVAASSDSVSISIDSLWCQTINWQSATEAVCTPEQELANGHSYKLSLAGVQDTARNRMPDTELFIRFFISSEVHRKDIVISEIMPDPSPPVGLPEVEFIELYNRSSSAVQLAGWKVIDERDTALLPDRVVLPGDYLVLTSSTVDVPVSEMERWLKVENFPSLSNEGEYLLLTTADDQRIDSVNFSKSLFGTTERADGGWSLELIDTNNLCAEQENWTVAEDEAGGTPGKLNSVNANKPDLTGPRLVGVSAQSARTLLLTFDEKLERSISSEYFSLVPASGEMTVGFTDPSLRKILMTLVAGLKLSAPYQVRVAGLRDCAGNVVQEEHASLAFALPEDPLDGDVVINEILFNPRPGGTDFLEIYNRGTRYVDISDWKIAKLDGELVTGEPAGLDGHDILAPMSYRVFTEDRLRLLSEYPRAVEGNISEVSLPSMPDDEGSIAIVDAQGHFVDSVSYDENFHSSLVRDRDGVSLERISMTTSSLEPSNWMSAAESAGYATPGFLNSSSREASGIDDTGIFVSPEVISFSGADNFAMIVYRFEQPGNYITCGIFDQHGRLIKELAQNMSAGYDGFLRWDGGQNDGTRARPGYYVVVLECFNMDGAMQSVRKRVVVAPR